MIDFKIRSGLSSDLFINGEINPRLIIEKGCWYLTEDTAELFVGIVDSELGLTLKRINEVKAEDLPTQEPTEGEVLVRSIIDAFVDEETGMLHLIYSDNTEDIIGPVIGKDGIDGKDGRDGLITTIKVNGEVFEHKDGIIELPNFITEHQDLSEYAKSKTVVSQKYEVLPFDGAIINYADNEVRVNTQYVDINSLPTQNAGDGSSNNYYYMTFRAYAPDGATSVIEGSNDKMDANHSTLAIDGFGRKYTTIWAAIASKNGDSWSKFGDNSTVDKYLGFYYNFHWYKDDIIISKDKVRVILTNDACHNDLVPDAVARRIDEKIKTINVPSIEGLATEEYVDNARVAQGSDIEGVTGAIKTVDSALSEQQRNINWAYTGLAFGAYNQVYGAYSQAVGYNNAVFSRMAGAIGSTNKVGMPNENSTKVMPNGDFNPYTEAMKANLEGWDDGRSLNGNTGTDGTYIFNPRVSAGSFAAGTANVIYAPSSVAFGASNYIVAGLTGGQSAAIGYSNTVKGNRNFAIGANCIIGGKYTGNICIGDSLRNNTNPYKLVTGVLNKDTEGTIFEVGNGEHASSYKWEDSIKSNAFEVYRDGRARLYRTDTTTALGENDLLTNKEIEDKITESLANYITNDELSTKALFTTAKYVTNPIGDFIKGEDIKDLTVAELFAKLLGLSDVKPGESPDIPGGETVSIRDTIINNKLSIYQADGSGTLSEVPFKQLNLSEETAATESSQSGFYTITNANEEITEYGYQHATELQPEMFYMIAIPSSIVLGENADLLTWDAMNESWIEDDYSNLTNDFAEITEILRENDIEAPVVNNGYTLWADLNEANPGRIYRIRIREEN